MKIKEKITILLVLQVQIFDEVNDLVDLKIFFHNLGELEIRGIHHNLIHHLIFLIYFEIFDEHKTNLIMNPKKKNLQLKLI
jgi:hypothetical protein